MSILELLMAANNKPLYKICIFSLGSNALVTALLPLTYFLFQTSIGYSYLIGLRLLYLPTLASPFLKMAFLYSPYAYLLFLMLVELS